MPDPEPSASMREVLETGALELFEHAVDVGGIRPEDPRIAPDGPDRPAFDALVALGLLIEDDQVQRFVPTDPGVVGRQVVTPIGQRAVEMLEESSRWSDLFVSLGQSYRRAANAENPVTEIRGLANINRFLSAIIDDAQFELLTAQPTRGRSDGSLDAASERDVRAVKRGVSMRTLYQHSARRSSAIVDFVAMMTPLGVQVRTLEEFFNRMIVVDRHVAVVPGADRADVAIAVHDPSLVAYLVDVFERYWERGRTFDDRGASTTRSIAADLRDLTLRMLVEGHSDPASAKRLGVSTRTFAGYIAALKAEFGVQTRFQLGWAMARQASADADEQAAGEDTGKP